MTRSRTSFSDSNFVRWYGWASFWPSSNMSSLNVPWSYRPATAIEDMWWNVPTSSAFARSIACWVPPTLSSALRVSSAPMS